MAQKEVELSNEFPDTSECKMNIIFINVSVSQLLMVYILNSYGSITMCNIICVKQSKKSSNY